MSDQPHRRFLVHRTEDSDLGERGDLLGWGCQYPTGVCLVAWRLEAFPEEERLDHEHESRYGSIRDVKQGTGGAVRFLDEADNDRVMV